MPLEQFSVFLCGRHKFEDTHMNKKSILKANFTLITMVAFIFVLIQYFGSYFVFSYSPPPPLPPYLILNILTILIYSDLMYKTEYKKPIFSKFSLGHF